MTSGELAVPGSGLFILDRGLSRSMMSSARLISAESWRRLGGAFASVHKQGQAVVK